MAHAYILECSDGSFYTGSTTDLDRRLWEHNEGLGANYTRTRKPVKLVWCAFTDRIEDAFRWEKQIQGWSRAKKRALIEGRLADLPRLSQRRDRSEPGR
jgi:putative endonuclease